MPRTLSRRTVLLLGLALLTSAPVAGAAEEVARLTVPTPAHPSDAQLADTLARAAFAYFWNESHPETGLTRDRARNLGTEPETRRVASAAATGYALAALAVGAERGWIGRQAAYGRALTTLRFVYDRLPHFHGFYYHFVDWETGERVWKSEVSSIDSALLVLGALAAGRYWRGTEVERLAEAIYARMDFPWMQRGDGKDPSAVTLCHGWKPEGGWLKSRWDRYSEASFLYFLAMGSPTMPLGPEAWDAWKMEMAEVEGYPVFGGPNPLFFAQMTPGYFDLRGLRDRQGHDWWADSRYEHLANHAFCLRNPGRRKTYAAGFWGLTASDQPNGYGADVPAIRRNRGTVAPTAMIGGMFVVPELSRAAARALWDGQRERLWGRYGFSNAFNLDAGWYDPDVIGIDLGMMLLALENYRSGLIWRLMGGHPAVKRGLAAAGMHSQAAPARRRRRPVRVSRYCSQSPLEGMPGNSMRRVSPQPSSNEGWRS
jgi:hypothetical protein